MDVNFIAETIKSIENTTGVPEGFITCDCGMTATETKLKENEKLLCPYCVFFRGENL